MPGDRHAGFGRRLGETHWSTSRAPRVDLTYGTVLAQFVDGAFDGVALLVGVLVEGGSPPAVRSAFLAVADLIGRFGDRRGDPAAAQVGPDRLAGVGLVGQEASGAGPGSAPVPAANADPVHDRGVGEAVVTLPGAGDPGQQSAL